MDIEQSLVQANTYDHAGQIQDAERLYHEILQIEPKHPEANHNLAKLLIQKDQVQAALPLFLNALESKPNSILFWLGYINTLIYLEQYEEANNILEQGRLNGLVDSAFDQLEAFLRSKAQVDHDSPTPLQIESVMGLYSQGKIEEALESLNLLIKQYPGDPVLYNFKGTCCYIRNQKNESIDNFKKALSLKPDYAEAHYNIGNVFHFTGVLDAAIKSYERALKIKPNYPEVSNNLGFIFDKTGEHETAIIHYRKAISDRPDFVEAYNNLGLSYRNIGQLDLSVLTFEHALEIAPNYPESHSNLGLSLNDLGQLDDAITHYHQALKLKPDFAEVYNRLGTSYNYLNEFNKAITSYEEAIKLDTNHFDAYSNLANVLSEQGKFDLAISYYKKALLVNPDFAEAYYNLGVGHMNLNQLEDAIKHFKKAIKLKSDYVEALGNLGISLSQNGQLDEAICIYEQAIQINPDYAELYCNLGLVLHTLGQFDEAILMHEQALSINPDFTEAYFNLGNAFKEKRQFVDAVKCYQQALCLSQELTVGHNNLGVVLKDLGEQDKAISSYEQALFIDPEYVEARWNLSLVQLLTENFKEGWENYESRWLSKDHDPERHYPHSKWEGQPLKDKSLLIYTEQGIGDEVMFCSCLPDLISQAPELIVLECDHRLNLLLERSFPKVEVVIKQALDTPNDFKEFTPIDFQVAIGTLPRILRSDFKFFPTQQSFLKADSGLVNKWRDRFSELGTGLNIGISWRGGRIESTIKSKSTPLSLWASVLKSDANFINLQYGDCIEEINQVEESMGVSINDWSDADPLKDLDNFAAQIAALDLVISIDNSTVQFAGALGTPVWVLLPFAPEWRWFLNRDDSPWYPSVRLFRQKDLDEWGSVFEEVINSLKLHDRQIQITADLTALLTATIKAFRMEAIPEGHKKLIALLELLASQTTTLSEEKVLQLKMLLNKVLKELEQNNYGAITEILEKEIAVLLNLSLEILPLN